LAVIDGHNGKVDLGKVAELALVLDDLEQTLETARTQRAGALRAFLQECLQSPELKIARYGRPTYDGAKSLR